MASKKKQERQEGVQVPGRTDDGLSNQAQFASYEEAEVEEANPPNGPQTIQKRGEPEKGPVSYG
jgi:hypothetical protein